MTVAKRMDPQKSEEARECYELSLAGYSQRQIADKMGHSQSWVRDRLKLHTENRVHPKADEYRAQQIDRARIYIRSLWSQVLAGDPKAIAQAIRTEERISKLLGLDSATQFVVKAEPTLGRETEFLNMLNRLRASRGMPTSDEPPRVIRASKERPAIAATNSHNPEAEFATGDVFQPHEVNREEVEFADDVEEFEPAPQPKPRRRGKPIPNPAHRFLVDSDD